MKGTLSLEDVVESLMSLQAHLSKAEKVLENLPREPTTSEHATQLLILHEHLINMKAPVKKTISAVDEVSSRFACDLIYGEENTTLNDFEDEPDK
jgi:hypothetical protein